MAQLDSSNISLGDILRSPAFHIGVLHAFEGLPYKDFGNNQLAYEYGRYYVSTGGPVPLCGRRMSDPGEIYKVLLEDAQKALDGKCREPHINVKKHILFNAKDILVPTAEDAARIDEQVTRVRRALGEIA